MQKEPGVSKTEGKKKFPECSSSQADHLATLCRENSYLKFTRMRNLEPSQKSRHTGTTLPRSGGCCGQDTTPLHEQCPSRGVRHAPITEGNRLERSWATSHGLRIRLTPRARRQVQVPGRALHSQLWSARLPGEGVRTWAGSKLSEGHWPSLWRGIMVWGGSRKYLPPKLSGPLGLYYQIDAF